MPRSSTKSVVSAPTKRRVSPAHRSFVHKIGILRRLLDRYSADDLMEASQLTLAEWRALTFLYSFSPVTSRQLCVYFHADKAEVSRACAGLRSRGYATSSADPSDRRSPLISITPQGIQLHDEIIPLRQALQEELESTLTKGEIASLNRALDKLTQYVTGRIGGKASDL